MTRRARVAWAMLGMLALVCAVVVAVSCGGSTTSGMSVSPPSTASPAAEPAVSDLLRLERSIATTMKKMDCPGIVFAVSATGKSDAVIVKGVGDLSTGAPISAGDLFCIGSVTKTFTATMLLQLAAEGKVNLDDPLSKYEPGFLTGDNITVRMLLNHPEPLRNWTPDELVAIGTGHDPYLPPGTPSSASSGLGIGMVHGWVGNTGSTCGYTTWMWYVPKTKATVIVFFNETSTLTPCYEVREQKALLRLLQTARKVI